MNFYRYLGKTLEHQDLKHGQLVIKLSKTNNKIKFINQRTGRTQYFEEKLWNKYFCLASDKYKS